MTDDKPQLEGLWQDDTFVMTDPCREGQWIESDRSQDPETMHWQTDPPEPEIETQSTKTCMNPRCTKDATSAYCSGRCGYEHVRQVQEDMEESQ